MTSAAYAASSTQATTSDRLYRPRTQGNGPTPALSHALKVDALTPITRAAVRRFSVSSLFMLGSFAPGNRPGTR